MASPETVWRGGLVILGACLATTVLASLLLAVHAPELAIWLPAGLVGLTGCVLLFRYPTVNLVVLLAAFAVAADSTPGVQTSELIYGLYLCAFLVHWYGGRLWRGEPILRGALDRWVAVFLVIGGGTAVLVGAIFGASFEAIRGEVTAFMMLYLYFPVKELCRTHEIGAGLVVGVVVWLALFHGLRTFLYVRDVVHLATVEWQIADVRVGGLEPLILVGCFGSLAFLLHSERLRERLPLLAVFLFLTASLILTRGRSFWVAFALGVLVLLVVLKGRYRVRLITLLSIGTVILAGVVLVFFGQIADLIVSGTVTRMTMMTLGGSDASMLSRYVEWAAVWGSIVSNPIIGHGFGTNHEYFDVLARATLAKSFIHNAYLAVWFKMGIFGLLVWLFWWGRAIFDAFRVYRCANASTLHRTAAVTALAALAGLALAANTSIFFLVMDQVFIFAVLAGLSSGLFQRYRSGERHDEPADRLLP